MDKQKKTEIEAATFRYLRDYLREHTDVQNIDLMNLAGFCRNCLSKWYRSEAEKHSIDMDYDSAREEIYGMPYDEWKKLHQSPATEEQNKKFSEVESKK
jgi:hypothetical protein